eukprot:TRINITY_DN3237_c2_g1_i1.p1 TRINITY_DN3237_c2_g1~~TRINITY_DN3237_c2_g1_i1.p1  ORF type:complete len:252 (+),score=33.12 TRINITY_DN3237_c2_g1_i1:175-930(+)
MGIEKYDEDLNNGYKAVVIYNQPQTTCKLINCNNKVNPSCEHCCSEHALLDKEYTSNGYNNNYNHRNNYNNNDENEKSDINRGNFSDTVTINTEGNTCCCGINEFPESYPYNLNGIVSPIEYQNIIKEFNEVVKSTNTLKSIVIVSQVVIIFFVIIGFLSVYYFYDFEDYIVPAIIFIVMIITLVCAINLIPWLVSSNYKFKLQKAIKSINHKLNGRGINITHTSGGTPPICQRYNQRYLTDTYIQIKIVK